MQNDINEQDLLAVGATLQLGKYRIDGYLSSGGFGNTYVVTDTQFEERYALKEFFMKGVTERDGDRATVSVSNRTHQQQFASQKEKFKKEARRLRKFNNAHIVRVHDLFEENGTAYYVMDFIDGESIAEYIKRTRQPLTEAQSMHVLSDVLDALTEVHGSGIRHLDLKPANIMLDKSGNAVVIDFGASKQLDAQDGGGTSTSSMCYTAGYAPPEQMDQKMELIGAWTDLYALGGTLYYMLTQQRPPTISEMAEEGAFQFPPTLSDKTRYLIRWMMQLNRKNRPQSVEEVRTFLAKDGKVATEVVIPAGKALLYSVKPTADEHTRFGVASQGNDETELQQQQYESEEKPTSSSVRSHPWKWLGMIAVIAVIAVGVGAYWLMNHNKTTNSPVAVLSADTAVVDTVVKEEVTQEYMKLPEEQRNIIQNLIDNMVSVEGGTFTMGATAEQGSDAESCEIPAHKVTLNSFSIGKYEVTQEEWKAVMGSNPSEFKGAKRPVEKVSWDDCQTFIRKLNQLTGKQFRLPTEAEWEYAARGGNRNRGYKYSGSDNLGSVAWTGDNSESTTHPVGQKQANGLGLYDMLGNVWEWCQDWYGENYYSSSPSQNPKGPSTGSDRVNRGGGWGDFTRDWREWGRGSSAPGDRWSIRGLRLAL